MMKTNFDIRIETIIDGIRSKADDENIELVFDHVSDCDNPSYNYAAFVQNVMTERFGVMCLQMENKDPEEIQFLTFSPKLYQYGQAEGFTKDESLEQWGDKILKNVKLNNFIEFIFSEETY